MEYIVAFAVEFSEYGWRVLWIFPRDFAANTAKIGAYLIFALVIVGFILLIAIGFCYVFGILQKPISEQEDSKNYEEIQHPYEHKT